MTFEPGKRLAEAAVNDRILYSSTGGPSGRARVAVSGGVYLPKGRAPRRGWPVIAWAHGTVGFPDICAPSFNGWSERDTNYLNNWLSQGYAVVASDYEGLGTPGPHPYFISRSEAQGVLDSVVAARKRYPLSRNVVLVGQSQGAHAATNAALMQPHLAPSLKVRGVVLTGWPGGLDVPPLKMNAFDPMAAFTMRLLPTYTTIDPKFQPESVLTSAGRSIFRDFGTTCGSEAIVRFMERKPLTSSLFTQDPSALEARAAPYRAYPPLAFKVPVFLGIGTKDEQASPAMAYQGAKRACALRSRLTVRLYPGLMHSPTVPRSQQDSIPWVRAAFAGRPLPGNCQTVRYPAE